MSTKVRNIKTGDIFYIWPDDREKVGQAGINVPVFLTEPEPGGCKFTKMGPVSTWSCGIKKSVPDKKFRSDFLELIESSDDGVTMIKTSYAMGAESRLANVPVENVPETLNDHEKVSWIAGWNDADQGNIDHDLQGNHSRLNSLK